MLYYKKHGTMVGYGTLNEEDAKMFDEEIKNAWYQKPYAPFELTNNNQNLHRLRQRLENLKKIKSKTESNLYPQVDGITIEEDKTDMRIRLIFEDIPDEETRSLLKSYSFKWSPKNKAWQRQLTNNGIYFTKKFLEKLKEKK